MFYFMSTVAQVSGRVIYNLWVWLGSRDSKLDLYQPMTLMYVMVSPYADRNLYEGFNTAW